MNRRERYRRRQGVTIDHDTRASRPVVRGLGQVTAPQTSTVAALAARSALEPTAGDVKAQGVRLADIFVFGPLMLFAGLGKDTPQWVKIGMIVIGAGTIVYNLVNWFEIARRQGTLTGMTSGPVERAKREAAERAAAGGPT